LVALKHARHNVDQITMDVRTVFEIAIAIALVVVCALKGKWGFVVLGFALPILWVIGAVKMAKPNSFWARQYYGDVSMSESEQHFVLSKRKRRPPISS
jgi:hypothetical protein